MTYARNLAASGQFAFNPGEATYGFSSPAWVIVLAGASRLTRIPVGAPLSDIVGIVACCLAAAAAWSIWSELDEPPGGGGLILAAVLFSGPWAFTVWFLCGMETGLAVLGVLAFLLWLTKLRAGAARFPWLPIGILGTALLATTRLEAGIYVACALVAAFATAISPRQRVDIALVALIAGGTEVAWLLFAHRAFGTYMPWTSTARLIYYLPYVLHVSGYEWQRLGLAARGVIAFHAIVRMAFGGPLKILTVVAPLAAAAWILWLPRRTAPSNPGRTERLHWMLKVAAAAMLLEMAAFSYLFPLVQNRHLAPYSAGIWVLAILPVTQAIASLRAGRRAGAIALTASIWVGGALQYRHMAKGLAALHQLAASGRLTAADRVAAEPIGIVSFESPARVIDIGGLTDRGVWPLLMHWRQGEDGPETLIPWDIQKGATKILLACRENMPASSVEVGAYCLVDAGAASQWAASPSR